MRSIKCKIVQAVLPLAALFFYAGSLCAMDWPSPDALLVRNFGWNDRGKPVLGTVFKAESGVLAAESGELIFSRREEDAASRLPSPLGNLIALDHGDGLISIYSRCGEANLLRGARRVERQTQVAEAGVSGWSEQKGFYFVLYDRRERRWVNPSMIITPFPDNAPPRILAVDLKNAQGTAVPRGQTRMSQGRYAISVSASDTLREASGENALAPHRIVCSVNGAGIGSLIFETISARDGVLMVYRNGLVPARQVYSPQGAFEAGEVFLTRGQANLEIIVQDISGNARSYPLRLAVE